MRGSVRLLILAFVFPALLLVGSSPVGAVNNSLRLGYVVGDILWTPTPDYSELTHLSIPAGTWLVTVTATVDAAIDETTGHGFTGCDLANGGTILDEVGYRLNADANSESVESVFLTVIRSSSSSWNASFRCKSNALHNIRFRNILISAVKGVLSGSGGPQLRRATDTPGINVAGDSAFHTLLSINVAAGNWWLAAKTITLNGSFAGANNIVCRLAPGADTDLTGDGLARVTSPSDSEHGTRGLVGVQVAHKFDASATVAFQCKGNRPFAVSDTHIVAIKAGTLKRAPLGGTTSTSGSGTPTVMTTYRASAISIPSGTSFSTVASFPIPAGNWLAEAKAQLNDSTDARVECRLLVSEVTDGATSYGGSGAGATGLYMQDASNAVSPTTGLIQCKASSTGTTLTNLRVTLISGSGVTYVAMPS